MKFERKQLCLILALMIAGIGCVTSAKAELCGMMGSDASIPGNQFSGYWRTTFGLMRLVRFGPNMVEGPSTASGYLKGVESGNFLQGRLAEDTGAFHPANFSIQMTEGGRCLKGTYVFDGDKEVNEIIGFRIKRPSEKYAHYYEITDRTEQLKRIVGGFLNLNDIDGPDIRAAIQGQPTPPAFNQPLNPQPLTSELEEDPEAHEDTHERSEEYR